MRLSAVVTAVLPLFVGAATGPLAAQASGPFTVAETGRSYARLQDAVGAIGAGAGTIRIAPGTYRECAVQAEGRIAYVAAELGRSVFERVACEDKAALVLRGAGARVDGLVFTHLQVADGNGAGIRIEKGDLAVANTRFIDNQSGILSASDPTATITVDRSTFAGLGKDPTGNGAHGIYVGGYGALTVTRSRFERGTGGHYLKSRAPRVTIVDNSFDDSAGQGTNYMIDLSNGATGRIAGNTFEVGPNKDNYSTMITVAPEGAENPSTGLVVENNRAWLTPAFRWKTTFVGNWSGDRVTLRNNQLAERIAPYADR
ncbi:right-handed parallel beta-helix repeat-containing protein [Sphingomonas desiccabilis]|uniref:Right-handed parallel beta-helix repeat-containing protein n=1 Tax=Sphingomonas desiccabilis TaxID=429134 RepID=A0A4Q2IUE5_9SPHN|nr:right-handed parallel beta-helix repeat-containing protein [Sphingomonas desiccabilis]MBB3911055.1 DNA-binding transcriptional regulator of glucitol operon [Sphingomonas desiccabilis]RXZ32130.1 right-handed parallel beta-helix repeat-containing protein [Sphingomonas desiccabilis]